MISSTARAIVYLVSFVALAGSVAAQTQPRTEPAAATETRAGEWRARRLARADAADTPRQPNRLERTFHWIRKDTVLERLAIPGAGWHGFRPLVGGGLGTGSGIGLGLIYDRVGMGSGAVDFSASAIASLLDYQRADVSLTAPRLLDGRLQLRLGGNYWNRPQEDFYGLGADAADTRTTFRLEEVGGRFEALYKPSAFEIGANVGFTDYNVGPGTDDAVPSSETRFDDLPAPGIDRQTQFWHGGFHVGIDTRNYPANPHTGVHLSVDGSWYDDQELDQFDFRRVTADAEVYIPFNNLHRVLALRSHVSFDEASDGHRVPFYLQQTLGGGLDLRAYDDYRFRDENQLLLTAEYRWEIWVGLDGALFVDAGKVFDGDADFDLDGLETDYGFGLRFNTGRAVFLRADIAHGDAGTKFAIKFEHIF